MGIILFVLVAILVLFGSPILITFIVSRIALSIKEKKEDKEKAEREKNN